MTNTGSGTGTPVISPVAMRVYGEFLSVADVRARYGTDADELTDVGIRADIDRMQSALESALGHGFGRVAWLWSGQTVQVQVFADRLTIGLDDYTWALYPTLGALSEAMNDAGYNILLAAHVRPDTPSALLRPLALTTCGPTYDHRVTLTTSALFVKKTGKREAYLFLPLPVARVVSVTENTYVVPDTGYWIEVGQPWLIRRYGSGENCVEGRGRWSGSYPDNIVVTYVPQWWNQPPAIVGAVLLDAFGVAQALTANSSESFLSYSYSRSTPAAQNWEQIVSGVGLRPYQVRFVF